MRVEIKLGLACQTYVILMGLAALTAPIYIALFAGGSAAAVEVKCERQDYFDKHNDYLFYDCLPPRGATLAGCWGRLACRRGAGNAGAGSHLIWNISGFHKYLASPAAAGRLLRGG